MKRNLKISIIAVLALILAIYSFTTSYSLLSNKDDGVAILKEEVNRIDVVVKDSITSSEDISFIGDPVVEDNDLIFSIDLDKVDSFGQIYFDINNNGDYDCIYKGIEVVGLDDYKSNVDISVIGINMDDKIEKGMSARNLSVKVSYTNDSGNIINLNIVKVKFILEVVK